MLLVDAVHLGEVVHGGQEDVDLDNLADVGAGGGEHGLDVGDAALGQLADAAGQDLAAWRARDLPGAVDGGGGGDGLGVRAGCFEGVSEGIPNRWGKKCEYWRGWYVCGILGFKDTEEYVRGAASLVKTVLKSAIVFFFGWVL